MNRATKKALMFVCAERSRLDAYGDVPRAAKLYTARQIAEANGIGKRQVQRRAAREHWPKRRVGNHFEFLPPADLLTCLARFMATTEQVGTVESHPALLRITPEHLGELVRAALRFSALLIFQYLQPARGVEKALAEAARLSPAPCSVASLRRWIAGWQRSGFAGLLENKRGVVGPKKRKR